MSSQHRRRSSRSRFQKPDTINIILGSLTIILLFVWGGLYWKDSTQQALTVNADGAALNEQAQPEEIEVIATGPVSTTTAGAEKPPAADQAVKPTEQPADKPGASEAALPEKEEAIKPAVPVKTAHPVKTTKPARTAKPNQETGTKPEAAATPVVTETEPPISVSKKYEQQMVQIQVKCTQDMNEVLVGAESSIEQLDQSDPYAFQQLNQKWTDGLANVESACKTKFQEITANAEHDSVEPEIIEEWEQSFSSLMLQLQGEFEAKLLQLMGG